MSIIVKDKEGYTICVLDKSFVPCIGDTIRVEDETTYHKVVDRIFEMQQGTEALDFVYLIVE